MQDVTQDVTRDATQDVTLVPVVDCIKPVLAFICSITVNVLDVVIFHFGLRLSRRASRRCGIFFLFRFPILRLRGASDAKPGQRLTIENTYCCRLRTEIAGNDSLSSFTSRKAENGQQSSRCNLPTPIPPPPPPPPPPPSPSPPRTR